MPRRRAAEGQNNETQGADVADFERIKSPRAGARVMRSITRYLKTTLKLTVNLAKSKAAPMSGCSSLGFTIVAKRIRWTDKSVAAFKHRVRELTGRGWGVSMEHRLHKLGPYVRGWTAYFGISQYYRPVPELDDWIRRRIRMGYWKQWRWVRTKIKPIRESPTSCLTMRSAPVKS